MVVFKGFEVTIQVNGRALEEYGDELEEVYENSNETVVRNTVTRYVEVTGNSPFSISMQFVGDRGELGPATEAITYYVYMDGQWVGTPVGYSPTFSRVMREIYDKTDGQWFKNTPVFSSFSIVETEPGISGYQKAFETAAKIQKMGTVDIMIRRANDEKPGKPNIQRLNPVLRKNEQVPEAALKGDSKSHYIQCTERVKCDARTPTNYNLIDRKDNPYALFRFKYCSRKCLEDMHIVPRPPTLEERNAEDLSRGEMLELIERMKARESEQRIDRRIKPEPQTGKLAGIKREHDASDSEVTATEERSVRRRMHPTMADEVVDLTED